MKKIHINAINRKLLEQLTFVNEINEKYEKKLQTVSEKIADERKSKPIILLAGPSGSGKTTTALKIDENLEKIGIKTHTISLDDYFLPVGKFNQIMDENGIPDYESPYRINIEKLAKDMVSIFDCKDVTIPKFEFKTQSSSDGYILHRNVDDIVVFEGIHALNPLVTGSSDEFAQCMYVSVRSRVELTNGKLVHPSMIRLMRRIIRDENYRGRLPKETMDMFDSVEMGENKYIMPFKYRADCHPEFSIDTFFAYEPAVYKTFLLDKIRGISKEYPNFDKFVTLLELLEQVNPLDPSIIPDNSLIKEFIGGSRYNY